MSFLDTIGKACFAGLRFAAPLFGSVAQETTSEPLHAIAGAVMAAEALSEVAQQAGGSKLDKLQLVLPEATAALLQSPLLHNKTIVDQAGFQTGVQEIVDGIVKVLKSVELGRTAPPAPAQGGISATTEPH